MCRSCAEGGRRCPGETAAKRRARQNAAYNAKKHATTPRQAESGTDDPSASAGVPPLEGPVTPEMVRERIDHARAVLSRSSKGQPSDVGGGRQGHGGMTAADDQGWLAPTSYGLEAEAATRAAGAALAARGEQLAADTMAETSPGVDKRVLAYMPQGAQSRDEYTSFVQGRTEELKSQIRALRKQAADRAAEGDVVEASQLTRQSNELVDEANRYNQEAARAHQADSAWDRVETQAYSDGYRAALAEQRQMGLPGGRMIATDKQSQKATVDRLKKGLAYYPSDWLARDGDYEASWRSDDFTEHQEHIPLRVVSAKKRAHYSPVVISRRYTRDEVQTSFYSELTIDKHDSGCLGPGVSTAVHEYGHRAERVQPQVNALAQVHLARRTTNGDGSRHTLEPYLVGKRRAQNGPSSSLWEYMRRDEGKSEWVRSDDFAERYTGKQNSSDEESSEVFTTGMEGVFAGRFGGLRGAGRWKADREHRDLILGTLAVVK